MELNNIFFTDSTRINFFYKIYLCIVFLCPTRLLNSHEDSLFLEKYGTPYFIPSILMFYKPYKTFIKHHRGIRFHNMQKFTVSMITNCFLYVPCFLLAILYFSIVSLFFIILYLVISFFYIVSLIPTHFNSHQNIKIVIEPTYSDIVTINYQTDLKRFIKSRY